MIKGPDSRTICVVLKLEEISKDQMLSKQFTNPHMYHAQLTLKGSRIRRSKRLIRHEVDLETKTWEMSCKERQLCFECFECCGGCCEFLPS